MSNWHLVEALAWCQIAGGRKFLLLSFFPHCRSVNICTSVLENSCSVWAEAMKRTDRDKLPNRLEESVSSIKSELDIFSQVCTQHVKTEQHLQLL